MQAREIYKLMVNTLTAKDWKFERHDSELLIVSSYQGEDIPIQFLITVDEEHEVVQFISPLTFNMPEDKRVEGAIAVCAANYGLVNGSFDYDIGDGSIRFRLTTSYKGCEIGSDFFMNMMATACFTTDRYNDRLMMLAKGMITVEKFIKMDK